MHIACANLCVGCHAEKDIVYGISWPSVNATSTTTVSVPCSRGNGMYVGCILNTYVYSCVYTCTSNHCIILLGIATRVCSYRGNWESPVVTNCSSHGYRKWTNLTNQVINYYTVTYSPK